VKRLTDDLVKEIVAKKTRAPESNKAVSWRMSSLLQTFHRPTAHRQELLRYFPIAVVATLEGYFRVRLAELIDHGEPFISNALKGYPKIEFDISMAGAITAKKISVGALITHSFGLNNFSSLVSAVTNISGRPNFLEEVAKIKPDFIGSETKRAVISNPKETWARLGAVFEQRHILCHELASELVLDDSEIRALLLAAQEFTKASAIWMDKLQNPFPEKVIEQKMAATAAKHKEAKASLEKTIANMKSLAKKFPKSEGISASIIEAENALNSLLASTNRLTKSIDIFHITEFDDIEMPEFVEIDIEEAETRILESVSLKLESAKKRMEWGTR
jgi:hypothetical protein